MLKIKKHLDILLVVTILVLTGVGVYQNILKQKAVDRSKIPPKVELNKGFQRWITNVKNKDIDISADDFKLKEENEIYNTKWMTVASMDDTGKKEEFEKVIAVHKDTKKVVFSPSEREFIDYRNETRDGYLANEVHFYGQKEDKIVDAKLLTCSTNANCYFDRAYFLDNDVFVISEFSRNIDKKDQNVVTCAFDQMCTYTVKVHVIDLINNSRLVYESKPFEMNMSIMQKEL